MHCESSRGFADTSLFFVTCGVCCRPPCTASPTPCPAWPGCPPGGGGRAAPAGSGSPPRRVRGQEEGHHDSCSLTRPPAIAVIPVAVRPTPATTNKSAPPYLISVSTTCQQSRIHGVHVLFNASQQYTLKVSHCRHLACPC